MKKFWIAMAVVGLAEAATAQTVIYAPVKAVSDQGITLRGWGSGSIAESDELAFEGTHSLRVSSRNFFQGGVVRFATPVDLSGAFGDTSNLIRVTFNAPDAKTTLGGGGGTPGGGKGGAPTLSGGPAGLGGSGGAGPQKGGGGGAGPQKGGSGPAGLGSPGGSSPSSSVEQPVLSMIRLIVTTSDGKKSEAYVPVGNSAKSDRNWRQVAVPLQTITGFENTNKMVQEIAFSGDTTSTFYVGDIRVINDTTPITGEIRQTRDNLALGDEITLSASGFGGSSVLKYEWDFDGDGKSDAEGIAIKHKFRKPGDITITLTISDTAGLKKAYQATTKIHVNP